MTIITSSMGLRAWSSLPDRYDHDQLADNWAKVDQHDHSSNRGVQIPTDGLADTSVTNAKIASNSVATANLIDGSVTTPKLNDGAVTFAKLAPTIVTSLPGSPLDGQIIDFVADATNGVVWRLRYRAASSSAYKWEFLGGGLLRFFITTSESTSSSTMGDTLTTVGPSITIPLAGDYDFDFGAETVATSVSIDRYIGLYLNGASPSGVGAGSDTITIGGTNASSSMTIGGSTSRRKTITSAASLVKLQYRSGSGGLTAFSQRYLSACPVRVG